MMKYSTYTWDLVRDLTKITKASKALHYETFFEDNKGNLQKTWEGTREIISISKKKKQMINNISD